MKYTCPKGHIVEAGNWDDVVCHDCDIIATSYNVKTGEVYHWTPTQKHRAACERMQQEIDTAEDRMLFGDEGW
jgi:hypothetical protein